MSYCAFVMHAAYRNVHSHVHVQSAAVQLQGTCNAYAGAPGQTMTISDFDVLKTLGQVSWSGSG